MRRRICDDHAPKSAYGTTCGISFNDEILKQLQGEIMSVETIEIVTEPVEIPQKIPIVADAYYTRKDLENLGICGWLTAFRHEKKGKLKACRIGRLVRYRGADIIQWLEGCKS